MRCKICDAGMDNPKWNKQLDDWEVCGTCLEIIFSVFQDAPEEEQEEEDDEDEIEVALSILDREEAAAMVNQIDIDEDIEIKRL